MFLRIRPPLTGQESFPYSYRPSTRSVFRECQSLGNRFLLLLVAHLILRVFGLEVAPVFTGGWLVLLDRDRPEVILGLADTRDRYLSNFLA